MGCWNFVYQNGGYILDEDGVHSIGSSRGASSHQYNPFAVVCEKDCGEDRGWCWGISLVYSGNFLIEAEKDQYSQLRVNAGINPMGFSFLVDPGQEFQAPQAVLLNSWETAYFDFDDEKLLDIAREAADLGVELFVLDDGWFGNRDSRRYAEDTSWCWIYPAGTCASI